MSVWFKFKITFLFAFAGCVCFPYATTLATLQTEEKATEKETAEEESSKTENSNTQDEEVGKTQEQDPSDKEQAADKPENSKSRKKKSDEELDPIKGVSFSNPVETKWQIGAVVVGGSSSARDMILTIPLPNDWPEQTVTLMEEKIPSNSATANYRDMKSGVRQLVVKIPKIRANQQIPIAITILVSTSQVEGPLDPTQFVRAKKSNREGKPYLGMSPQINPRDSKIRKLLKEITNDKPNVWEEIEAIYDWIGDNIAEVEQPAKDSTAVLKSKEGGNESKTGLFVAMCRAHKIPARMVWVEGTQHAEFMLADSQGNAHWFPCSVGGYQEFGSVSEPRIILQKGDSIKVPEKDRVQKFVAEFAICKGAAKPQVHFFRRVLADE
ncbi:MAG: transglutaminase family protein [Mariniblastus sp.]